MNLKTLAVNIHFNQNFCAILSSKQVTQNVCRSSQWYCPQVSVTLHRSRQPKTQHFKRRHHPPTVPRERLFSGMMTSLTLIFSAWEGGMKDANRWSLSDVGADYLISLSNWPESCCYCFASAELTYLNLISVYKSIWGFLSIYVCWECSRKYKRFIHKCLNFTDERGDAIPQPRQSINIWLTRFLGPTILGILNIPVAFVTKKICHKTKYYNDCFVVKIK